MGCERSADCEAETPLNRDPALDREILLSLQHVATSHKRASQSLSNSHRGIRGNGLQGLAFSRQVADDRHTTARSWRFMNIMTERRLKQQWPCCSFCHPTHSLGEKPTSSRCRAEPPPRSSTFGEVNVHNGLLCLECCHVQVCSWQTNRKLRRDPRLRSCGKEQFFIRKQTVGGCLTMSDEVRRLSHEFNSPIIVFIKLSKETIIGALMV